MTVSLSESHFSRAAFAEQYDAVRPRLPGAFLDLLCQYARTERPRLVVDLGCGTGLSTIPWAGRAVRAIGLEPADAMVDVARAHCSCLGVELRTGFGHQTGVADGAADIVTAVQAFHWMEPQATLAEVARILRPGGVFAAADCGSPAVDWEVEAAGRRFIETATRMREELGLTYAWPDRWPKGGHLGRLRESGHFVFTREVLLHGTEMVSAERYVQQTINVAVEDLDEFYARGATDEQLGLEAFRAVAERIIGTGSRWFTEWRVRLGVRA